MEEKMQSGKSVIRSLFRIENDFVNQLNASRKLLIDKVKNWKTEKSKLKKIDDEIFTKGNF